MSTTPRPFCYQRFQPTYLPFTSPHYNRARQQDPRVGVVPDSVKLLIGVHYKYNPSLARASSFVTGHEPPYYFRCSLSNAYTRARLTVFSVFEVGNNHCYFQAPYFTSRLSRLPPIAAWTSCRSSIFFQQRSRTQRRLHWSVDMNQQP